MNFKYYFNQISVAHLEFVKKLLSEMSWINGWVIFKIMGGIIVLTFKVLLLVLFYLLVKLVSKGDLSLFEVETWMEYRIMKILSITASIIIVPIDHMSYLLSLRFEEVIISLGCNLLSLRFGNLASLRFRL